MALLVACDVACFDPRVPQEVPCPDGVCPNGQVCSPVTQTCVLPGQGGNPDAAVDAEIVDGRHDAFDFMDAPAGSACYGQGFIKACFASAPTGAITIDSAVNTDTDARCGASSSATCEIVAGSIVVSGTTTVTGSRPLVLVAATTIDVNATLDASSHQGKSSTGPAANSSACLSGTPPFAESLGGAAGGSFATLGGRGGSGADDTPAGTPGGVIVPSSVMGGCPGQSAGSGAGGAGGGAVYLIAGTSITIAGTIDASGAGGGPSTSGGDVGASGGGTGAGAGGMIGLDAPVVQGDVTALIIADGGGGGGGAAFMGANGGAGLDPISTAAASGGAGGSASFPMSNGGNGGIGAAAGKPGGAGLDGEVEGGAGGGGGGGEGVIEVWGTFNVSTAVVSPPATTH